MTASIQIDQVRPSGTSVGTAGQARNDLWTNRLVNLSTPGAPNTNPDWAMLSQPKGSTAALAGATTFAASFTPDLPGTYRIRCRVNGGVGLGNEQIRVARVRFDTNGFRVNLGLVLPAPGELDGESNYGGNARAWDDPWNDVLALLAGPKRTALTTPVAVTIADRLIITNLTTPGAVAVNLPALPDDGEIVIVKDGKGDAAANNVTVNRGGTDTIEGSTTKVISTNFGLLRLVYDLAHTTWLVL